MNYTEKKIITEITHTHNTLKINVYMEKKNGALKNNQIIPYSHASKVKS